MRCSKLLLLLIAQFWLRLNLVGRQQQSGFGIRNPLDESNVAAPDRTLRGFPRRVRQQCRK